MIMLKGSSINDVTVVGGRGYQGFCDNSTKASVIKSVTIGEAGVINVPKLRGVIYGRPLNVSVHQCWLTRVNFNTFNLHSKNFYVTLLRYVFVFFWAEENRQKVVSSLYKSTWACFDNVKCCLILLSNNHPNHKRIILFKSVNFPQN
jgi:hypothetical protein